MKRVDPERAEQWPHLSKKRFEKKLKRARKKQAKRKRVSSAPLGPFSTSRILDFCAGRIRGDLCVIHNKQTAKVAIPRVFSFIDAPDLALNVLCTISKISRMRSVRCIDLDHSACEVMDIGASLCLDILCMEIWKEWKHRGAKRTFKGELPKNDDVELILRGTGIIKHLQVRGHQLPTDLASKFIYFPLRKGYKPVGSLVRSTMQEKTAQDLALYFDQCLRAKKFKLTPEGLKYICSLVGEVIDNAEEHSGHRQWFAVGYMDQSKDVGECQLAIVNFGRTIYESLSLNETPASLKNAVSILAEKHTRSGLFSVWSRWTEENLWTLYALQDGVSRWSGTAEGQDRGTGTVKMIEFFQVLGDSATPDKHPQMTLVSGSTRIRFDNQYLLSDVVVDGESRKIIAFNAANSLDQKPSRDHVHSLDGFFPGTVLSLRFYIDRDYLSKLKEENHANPGS